MELNERLHLPSLVRRPPRVFSCLKAKLHLAASPMGDPAEQHKSEVLCAVFSLCSFGIYHLRQKDCMRNSNNLQPTPLPPASPHTPIPIFLMWFCPKGKQRNC